MRIFRISLVVITLCSFFILTSCDKEKLCTNNISNEDISVVHYYNAFYDFFNAIESFDFEKLKTEHILFDKGANSANEIRYELNFPNGYVDESGNSISGKITYLSKYQTSTSGENQVAFEFEDVEFNGIAVDGGKILDFTTASILDWCGRIVFTLNSEIIIFSGTLSKIISPRNVIVSGTSALTVGKVEYEMQITEPILKEKNCPWFTSGELAIKGDETKLLQFNEGCNGIEMTFSNFNGCHTVLLEETHNLW